MASIFYCLCCITLADSKNNYNPDLKKIKTIQNLIAVCLLVLFTAGNIPKIYFHDVIANHRDAIITCDHLLKVKTCIHQKVLNCQAEEPVLKTPYLNVSVVNSSLILFCYQDFHQVYFSSAIQFCFIHKESRGPPVV